VKGTNGSDIRMYGTITNVAMKTERNLKSAFSNMLEGDLKCEWFHERKYEAVKTNLTFHT
jgi:hypothetical protein